MYHSRIRICLLAALLLAGCGHPSNYIRIEGFAQGLYKIKRN